MKKFALVSKAELAKINVNNLKKLRPERQVQAIRLWVDQNIKKYGPEGSNNNTKEMQAFIQEAAEYFGLYSTSPEFQRALMKQEGWGDEWKTKVVDKYKRQINFQSQPDLRDAKVQGCIKKLVEDGGKGHHGNTRLAGNNGSCLHWRIGSKRIFGSYANGTFTLIGIGRHSGSGNSDYKVDLILGGTTSATTS